MYGKVFSQFDMSHNFDLASKDLEDEPQKVKAAVFSNIALCHLKLKNYYEVKKACDSVLEIDPKSVKAYYRRGTSHFESGDPQSALEDFTKVLINTFNLSILRWMIGRLFY